MEILKEEYASGDLLDLIIGNLQREKGSELNAFLTNVTFNKKLTGVQSNIHCYMIGFNGNDQPRVKDLARAVAARLIDYAIPRSEIMEAQEKDQKSNTTVNTVELKMKAKQLFTSLKKSGEGGEMLLYMLVQAFLGLPQLLCKMPLKTSSEMHYHGADGIHIGYDRNTKKLALYWGESKLYKSFDSALKNCLDSLKPFLFDDGGTQASQNRDLQLITDNLDLCNEELEDAILDFLNPNSPSFKKMQYRGVCLIGFDNGAYPLVPNSKDEDSVLNEIKDELGRWEKKLEKQIKNRTPLDSFILEVFLVPFPCVKTFRDSFLGELANV
ncbi:TPA: DUF1837 domain-containing protein [Bacillus cereus]|uniref:Anti-bacteriophage protein A/HamA C-terminal domain-containing protein n=2 Tax=Bacillus cereus TaxID=1396 RepID=Q73D60_BACC1|nr:MULTISPECIES: DUF1837 domain-containing protein [Bacillus cereus group]AAS39785.1 hypothetical protein BCE_0854 [Bacillus cereus ATCC 10987]ACK89621.1 conserved hypothetical protein [Bacillus cereus AH820]MDK7479005.1 DUF1837 domain-containing protein [Bacillus cereus]MDR4261119.1 DUF1837 domain-containing protein [Bacillus pacificus]HDR4577975.1 DUF1837 domain-containing protein [Bacillus cereus]